MGLNLTTRPRMHRCGAVRGHTPRIAYNPWRHTLQPHHHPPYMAAADACDRNSQVQPTLLFDVVWQAVPLPLAPSVATKMGHAHVTHMQVSCVHWLPPHKVLQTQISHCTTYTRAHDD